MVNKNLKRLSKLLIIVFIFSVNWKCKEPDRKDNVNRDLKNINTGNGFISSRILSQKIRSWVKIDSVAKAHQFIDSLILLNKKSSVLYFYRGFVKGVEFNYESAIEDFTVAQELGYDKTKCQKMISVEKYLMSDGSKN